MNKKWIVLMLALCLMLTACGGNTETAPEAPDVETETVVPQEPEVVDPDVGVPAAPTEEPDVMPEMPSVNPDEEAQPEEEEPQETPVAPPAQEAPSGEGVDLNAFYESLVNTYGENFPANMNMTESQDMLDTFYPGLSAIGTNQMMIFQPMMGAVVCEVALVEVADAADVEAVKAIFQSRIDTQVDGGAWYPESVEGWKSNSRIVANGNYVMMIAYSECDAVVEAFNGLF